MTKEFTTIHFEIETKTPIKMDKFNGLKEEKKIKKKSPEEQAEAKAYRHPNGNLAIPSDWVYGTIIKSYYERAGKSSKGESEKHAASRIQVKPIMLDLGFDDYEIDVSSAGSGGKHGGTRTMFYKPMVEVGATVEGDIITSLDIKELYENFKYAGTDMGIGSDRKHGYGRFEITAWEVE